jgi:hypothetical protein
MMLSAIRTLQTPVKRAFQLRTVATEASKRAGDISDAFVSLSGQKFAPLGPEYASLKGRLIKGHEEAVRESWERLLRDLREEIPHIVETGSKVIPVIDFKDIDNAPETFSKELRKRGVAVVRGVVPEQEALGWKEDLKEYIKKNPQTKGTHYSSIFGESVILTHASIPSREPPSFRTLLVANPDPYPRSSKHAQNATLPHVLLAQREPAHPHIHQAPHKLR